ncbi:hypothetical protein JXC34_01210 [Candidatus Woesearchaeota archaeon]|nr:hypothetical protein [Candidatus Woesearchaeota archaeon]
MGGRILFLGTGGDAFVVGKQYRSSGGIIFISDKNQFHLDPGPGSLVMAKMMGINLRENTALFVSKNDLFKANDINAVISAMTHNGLDKRGVLVCPPSVVSKTSQVSPFLNEFYKNCLEKVMVTDNTNKIAINDIEIEIIKLVGRPTETSGFKFITPKFTLGYIPDTEYSNELGEKFADTDILILSIQNPKNVKNEDSLNCDDAEKIIKKATPQLAILTGFGIKMLQAETLYEAREMQKNTGIQIIAAKDGMTINPVSFTTAVRQKKLQSY